MDFRTIKIFCDLVQLKNFSRTAELHGISQSAVSQQLASLEIEHKCQFINRKKRPLSLTPEGELFYLACKDILDRYDRLSSELANLTRSTSRINVAAIFSIGMHTLQPYVKKFMAQFPSVNLHVEYWEAEQIYEGVLKGDIDIGVVAVARKIRHIEVYPFEHEPLVLVCNPSHPLASASTIDIHRLQGQDFIAVEQGVPTREWIDGILSQYNVTPRIVLEFDNIETIKRAVEIGAGISILPETTIHAELANGTIHAVPFINEKLYRPTHVIVRKNKSFTRAGKYLLSLLQQKTSIDV